MLRSILILFAVAFCASCAKFPSNGAATGSMVTFSFTMQEPVTTSLSSVGGGNYVYAVAIRATAEANPPINYGPLPVQNGGWVSNGIATGNPGGGPTHLILFNSQNPTSQSPYELYAVTPLTTSGGGDLIPIRALTNFLTYTPPSSDGTTPGSSQLQFSVFLSDLVANQVGTGAIQNLQVNFLTRQQLSSSPGTAGNIPWDSLGESVGGQVFAAVTVPVYTNTTVAFPGSGPQPATVSVPSLQISQWSVQVQLH